MTKVKTGQEMARDLMKLLKSGSVPVEHLSGVYVEPVVKDGTIVVALHAGPPSVEERCQGMIFALKSEFAVDLITKLAQGVVSIGGLGDQAGDENVTVTIELGKFKGPTITKKSEPQN